MFGIDVSYHQKAIDWQRVAAARRIAWCRHDRGRQPSWVETDHADEGIGFAVIKATGEETAGPVPFRDSRFVENWKGAKAAGIVRGAYHFMDGGRESGSGRAEAEFFLAALDAAGGFDPDRDLRPIVDVEWPHQGGRHFDIEQLADFLETVEAAIGALCIVYSGRWYWDPIPGAELKAWCGQGRDLWVAAYTWPKWPAVPAPWTRATIWQFTDRGRLDGIAGDVDLNVLHPEASLAHIAL